MDEIKVTIPSKPEYVTTLRLISASMAQLMQFNIEDVEDIRVCISEAVNHLIPLNETLDVCFLRKEDRLVMIISAKIPEKTGNDETDLHHLILESLMDEVIREEKQIVLEKLLSR